MASLLLGRSGGLPAAEEERRPVEGQRWREPMGSREAAALPRQQEAAARQDKEPNEEDYARKNKKK